MKLLPWIGITCCLLIVSTGCQLAKQAGGYVLWNTAVVLGNPDSLLMAKQGAGIDTFPVKNLQPPPTSTDLLITYGDEDEDGVVYFAHTNERLHYQVCVARIQEILQAKTGPVNLEIRTGKRDPFPWELQFNDALRGLEGSGRLNMNWRQVASSPQ